MGDPIVRTLRGAQATPWLDDLARLRIDVFAAWPYLYAGTADYERRYLEAYTRAPSMLLILAEHDGRIVGASSAMRLADESPNMRAPIEAAGLDPATICYFGESVLDPAFRGRGLGKRFFDERLAHAIHLGVAASCFAAVIREPDDPRRPAVPQDLMPLWRRYGFSPKAGLILDLEWPEPNVGDVSHRLQFWFRDM